VVHKMKPFKQYLNEFTITGLSTMLFQGGGTAGSLKIPISSSMYKRIWPETIRATVFHTTDERGLQSLSKLEGRKKSISAFFSMFARYMEKGIATSGGAIVEMDADVLMSASGDIMSQVDKSGSRWTTIDDMRGTSRYTNFDKVEKDFDALIANLVKKYLPKGKEVQQTKFFAHDSGDVFDIWGDMKKHLKGDGRSLNLLIKDYFDGMEKIIKKHSDTFYGVLLSYVKKRTTDESWDEQVVNNIKVKKVHLLEPTQNKIDTANPDRTHPIDAFEFMQKTAKRLFGSIQVWDHSIDLEVYTRQVAKAELKAMGVKKR